MRYGTHEVCREIGSPLTRVAAELGPAAIAHDFAQALLVLLH